MYRVFISTFHATIYQSNIQSILVESSVPSDFRSPESSLFVSLLNPIDQRPYLLYLMKLHEWSAMFRG